jgi:hypothetical protein
MVTRLLRFNEPEDLKRYCALILSGGASWLSARNLSRSSGVAVAKAGAQFIIEPSRCCSVDNYWRSEMAPEWRPKRSTSLSCRGLRVR